MKSNAVSSTSSLKSTKKVSTKAMSGNKSMDSLSHLSKDSSGYGKKIDNYFGALTK